MLKQIKRAAYFEYLNWQDVKKGRELEPVQFDPHRSRKSGISLFSCLRNEFFRIPFFVDYYRKLGVDYFHFVDNGSDDGFAEWAKKQADVAVYRTVASYKDSAFGMLWLNDLLRRFGRDKWCVVVDPDEFFVYPRMETRSLKALTAFLDEEKRHCVHSIMLDCYSDIPLDQAELSDDRSPFDVCPYFDGDGYVQVRGWGGATWIRGGPRLRMHFADKPQIAPALNKIPLIKWRRGYHYRMSTHDVRPLHLNSHANDRVTAITGALMHFKFVSQLRHKAEEESERGQHYGGGREYQRYAQQPSESLFDASISQRFVDSHQLISLGLISPGRWF